MDRTEEYIIDFERINELTFDKGDVFIKENQVTGTIPGAYTITKKYIKEFLDFYIEYTFNKRSSMSVKCKFAISNLVYNRVLIPKYKIREDKINSIIN